MGWISAPPMLGRSLTDVCKTVSFNQRFTPTLALSYRSTGARIRHARAEGTGKETHVGSVPQDDLAYAGDLGRSGGRGCGAEGAQGTGRGRAGGRRPRPGPAHAQRSWDADRRLATLR